MDRNDKILIVDDNINNIELLEAILEDDFNLETASSGKDALRIASEYQPDIVLLDIMMPDLDGYQVCRQIRQDSILENTKIIMVSAKVMLQERLAAYDAGADDYIVKPLDADELLAKVRVYFRLRRVEEMDKLKNDLLNMMCLESNNPLNSILMPLHTLIEDNESNSGNQMENINSILEGVSNLQQLFEKVLVLLALKTNKLKIDYKPEDLSTLVSNTVTKVKSLSLKKDVSIEEALPPKLFSKVDRVHMEYVLTTLLENTIKFSSANTHIDVKIVQEGMYLNLTLKSDLPENSTQCTKVQNIVGLAELQRSNLAIARYIMEKHGGSLSIEDIKGIGTDISLRLPLANAS